jgi:hypothetical protein
MSRELWMTNAFIKLQIAQLSTVGLLLAGLLSCGNLAQVGNGFPVLLSNVTIRGIQDIQANRKEFMNQSVAVRGNVVRQIPLLGKQAYEIQDPTGRIWVVTRQGALTVGTTATIQGIARYQAVPFAGQDLGEAYIEIQNTNS